jgi:hypothetical protein
VFIENLKKYFHLHRRGTSFLRSSSSHLSSFPFDSNCVSQFQSEGSVCSRDSSRCCASMSCCALPIHAYFCDLWINYPVHTASIDTTIDIVHVWVCCRGPIREKISRMMGCAGAWINGRSTTNWESHEGGEICPRISQGWRDHSTVNKHFDSKDAVNK